MNIGITIFITSGANIWNAGINQNIAFLAMSLRSLPGVDKIFLVNGGDSDEIPKELQFQNVPAQIVRPETAIHEVDALIVMGAGLPIEWTRRFKALGKKIYAFSVGQVYVGPAECAIFDRKGGAPFDDMPVDESWLLPQYMNTCADLLETVKRAPVYEMPHIWNPHFLELDLQARPPEGRNFGFVHKHDQAWRCAIMEPNISVAKNCVIAMLACEQAYRLNPDSIETMMVLNSFHMKEHPTFNSFARHLDLTRDHKATYEPRLKFLDCLIDGRIDAIVSHQWENAQNYVYYEALYGGYPLIHNSKYLLDVGMGFYYPDFEASTGGRQIIEAWSAPSSYWEGYRSTAASYLKTVEPTAIANAMAFGVRLFDGSPT